MSKMLVAVFDDEKVALEGLGALEDLHRDGDVALYATAVLVKDAAGEVSTKQSVEAGPTATALELFAGSLIGLLAGPVGLAAGSSAGTLTGLIADLEKSGIDLQFVADVAKAFTPGKAAVLADVEESWTTPTDIRLVRLGGVVFRRLRSELVEDQLAREAAAYTAELEQLEEELAQTHIENKAAIRKQLDEAKRKFRVVQDRARARIDEARREADARVAALKAQVRQASERRKAKIEMRVAAVKTDVASRLAKLQQAGRFAKEALAT